MQLEKGKRWSVLFSSAARVCERKRMEKLADAGKEIMEHNLISHTQLVLPTRRVKVELRAKGEELASR